MGNYQHLLSSSTISAESSSSQIPWSKQFSLLDKQPLNKTFILLHIPTNQQYKIKHLILNKTQNSDIFRQIDIKKNSPSPFVLQLEKVQQYTIKGYCSEHEEVFLMYKHVESNLKEEILNRRFKQERFSEDEVKTVLEAGVKGISYLYEMGSTPKGLNTCEILITSERGILINDPWLAIGSKIASQSSSKQAKKNSQQLSSSSFPVPVQQYPSPQKILYQNQLIQQYNEYLSELFTFGVIILEMIFMQPLQQLLYEKSQKKIFYHKVKEKIQEIVENGQLGKQINDKGENKGQKGLSLIEEIKQDLRRLLSHEPRIRQSVYLKYKKNKSQFMFLKKPRTNFVKQNQLSKYQFHQVLNLGNINPNQPKSSNYFDQPKNMNQQQQVYRPNYLLPSNNNELTSKQTFNNLNENKKAPWQYNFRKNFTTLFQPQKQQQNYVGNHYGRQIENSLQGKNYNKGSLRVVSSTIPKKNLKEGLSNLNGSTGIQTPGYHMLGRKNLQNNNVVNPSTTKIEFGSLANGNSQNKNYQFKYLRPQSNEKGIGFTNTSTFNVPSASFSINNPTNYGNILTQNTVKKDTPFSLGKVNNFNPIVPTAHYSAASLEKKRYGELSPKKQTLIQKETNTFSISDNNVMDSYNKPFMQSYSLPKFESNFSSNYTPYTLYTPEPYKLPNFTQFTSGINFTQQNHINTESTTNLQSQLNNNQKSKISLSSSNNNNFQQPKGTPSSNYNAGNIFNLNNNLASQSSGHGNYSIPYSSNFNNYQYKQVKSINYGDDSHLSNQKQSFVIQSYGAGNNLWGGKQAGQFMNKNNMVFSNYNKQVRAETPIGNLDTNRTTTGYDPSNNYFSKINTNQILKSQPTNYNPSPKNSFQINHSKISNFRNQGKSFSSMDQDIIQLKKFGQQRSRENLMSESFLSKNNYSSIGQVPSYSANQYGTVGGAQLIDRKFVENSLENGIKNDNRVYSSSLQRNSSHQSFGQTNQQPIQTSTHPQRNSAQVYLQTPQRYPQKGRLNSTIRQASCQDSGINQSINNSANNINPNFNNANEQSFSSQSRIQGLSLQPANNQGSKNGGSSINRSSGQKMKMEVLSSSYVDNLAFLGSGNQVGGKENVVLLGGRNSSADKNSQTIKKDQQSSGLKHSNNNEDTIQIVYQDGSKYIGKVNSSNQADGYGVLYYPDDKIAYQGNWSNGDFHGKGKLFNPYEEQMDNLYDYQNLTNMDEFMKQFEGIFSHDKKQGKGRMKLHNEEIYHGDFKDDLANGRGKYYCSDGSVIDGVWEMGVLKEFH